MSDAAGREQVPPSTLPTMFPTSSRRRRTLIVPLDDGDLSIVVEADTACLALAPRRHVSDPSDEAEQVADGGELELRVPARALVAALRVAWADEHDLRCFEPWRDVTRDGYWRDQEPRDGDHRWWDDLGDGDPYGYRDPHGYRSPAHVPPPRPYRPRTVSTAARSGEPWEEHEQATVREMWLAAAPDADKKALIKEIADRLERGEGGITARLRQAGCDPTTPGSPGSREAPGERTLTLVRDEPDGPESAESAAFDPDWFVGLREPDEPDHPDDEVADRR